MSQPNDLQSRFAECQQKLRALTVRPSEENRKLLWQLYKQAKYGNFDPEEDCAFDESAYHDGDADIKKAGWGDQKDLSQDEAMNRYIALAKTLLS